MSTPHRPNTSTSRLQSPRTPGSPAAGSTTVGASRVADSMVKVVDMHKKWQLTVQKGTQYCSAIENIKKSVLESKETDCNLYPANLELYCKNLAILITILEDVLDNLDTMIEQLKVLHVAMREEIVGKSWNLRKVLDAMKDISDKWKSELGVRKAVTENIGHAVSIAELALHVATWELLSSQNEALQLLFAMLNTEFSVPIA